MKHILPAILVLLVMTIGPSAGPVPLATPALMPSYDFLLVAVGTIDAVMSHGGKSTLDIICREVVWPTMLCP